MSEATIQVGSEVDSWCTKCKLLLNHTVVAMVDGKVKKVVCLTCNGQHAYRANAPGTRKAAGARKATRRTSKTPPPADDRPAKPYAVSGSYAENDVIEHAKFGRGTVVRVRGEKIDVDFAIGARTLLQGQQLES